MTTPKPGVRPLVPHFSSGPCAKRPGWNLQALKDALIARSHRSKPGRAKLKRAIDLTREILKIPSGALGARAGGEVRNQGPHARHRNGHDLPFQIGAPRWGGVSRGRQ